MTIRRGEVYWYQDRSGRRPVAVLTRDSAIGLLNRVTVAPATTTIRNAPTEVPLGPGDGMPVDCVLTLDNVRVVPKSALKGRISQLSPARMEQVCQAVSYAVGC